MALLGAILCLLLTVFKESCHKGWEQLSGPDTPHCSCPSCHGSTRAVETPGLEGGGAGDETPRDARLERLRGCSGSQFSVTRPGLLPGPRGPPAVHALACPELYPVLAGAVKHGSAPEGVASHDVSTQHRFVLFYKCEVPVINIPALTA